MERVTSVESELFSLLQYGVQTAWRLGHVWVLSSGSCDELWGRGVNGEEMDE